MTLPLLAPGSGLALPSLEAVPPVLAWGRDVATVRRALVRELLRERAFRPREEALASGGVDGLIAAGLAALLGPQTDRTWCSWSVRSVPRLGAAVLLTVDSAQCLRWGRLRKILAARDTRYAQWFYRTSVEAFESLGPVFGYSYAESILGSRVEMYDPDDAASELARALGDQKRLGQLQNAWYVRASAPPLVSVARWPAPLRKAIAATQSLHAAARCFARAMHPLRLAAEQAHEALTSSYEDGMPAWPLLITDEPYDLVDSLFDEEAQHFYEYEHAPNVVIPLPLRSTSSMHAGFAAVRALGALLAAATAWCLAVQVFEDAPGAHATGARASGSDE
ncbi:MAG: hypothetical protein H3C62_00960 [Gemmatimonadaceae bacterium]|nr:hypothetical protein [Gemmatimonadaceae bacterium]